MDWGLGDPQHKYLANRMMYSHKSVYYFAIVSDLFLRRLWVTTLIPPGSSNASILPYVAPFTMVAELFHRTMWSYFRLENEHLRNTQGFRRVDFIPLHFDHGVGGDKIEPSELKISPRMFRIILALVAVLLVVLSVVAIFVTDSKTA